MNDIIPIENITGLIFLIRGKKVMLDRDLAELYAVETRVLNQSVTRNLERFPEDFMITLTRDEISRISQIVTSSNIQFSKSVRAFTEQGVAGVVKITLIHGIKIIPLLFSNIDDFQKLFSL